MAVRVLGIVGTYRKGCVIDSLVSETLDAARQEGAQTEKIYLLDQHIEFCTNCRSCTQEPGTEPGRCVHEDDMRAILAQCRDADGLVLGAPVNFFNINALSRRFLERLVCFAYWPWGQNGPSVRDKRQTKKAVLITSTAMPSLMGRLFTGATRALKIMAQTLGARPIATVFAGMVVVDQKPAVAPKSLQAAREAGRKLAAQHA